MKTTSLKRSKKSNGPARGSVWLIVFVCMILFLIQWIFPGTLYGIVYAVSTPFTALRDVLGTEFSSIGTALASKESLAAENTELKKDLSDVSVKLLSMQALETENQALQNMVASKQAAKTASTVFAAVTERPPFSPYDTLAISSGATDGLSLGNPVFTDDGTPIGTIESVAPSSAKVLLFSSPETSIPVVIGEKKFEATAEGKGGGDFDAKVPVTDAPQQGDAVYIPEFAPAAIGTVESVTAAPTDTFADVLFSFPENIFELSFVTVDTADHFQIDINTHEATTTDQ